MEIQGQIKAVNARQTKSGKTVYDIEFSDGNTYATFRQNEAVEARNAVGSVVTANVESKPNGQYVNHYWNGIAGTVATAQAGQQTAPPVATMIPQAAPVAPSAPSDKDAQIARAVALKAAADLVAAGTPAADVVLELAAALEPYLLGVELPSGKAGGTPWDAS